MPNNNIPQNIAKFNEIWSKFLDERGLTDIAEMLNWHQLDGKLWFPYPAIPELGIEKAVKWRSRRSPNEPVKAKNGSRVMPYFLPTGEEKFLVLVEGETDTATAYGAGFSVLGVPGATTWQSTWWKLAEGYEKVVVFVEPDVAGINLLKKLAATLPDGREPLVTSAALHPHGNMAKDINALHVALGNNFEITRKAISDLVARAKQIIMVSNQNEMLKAIAERLNGGEPDGDGDHKALCPFHDEHTPSFDFGPDGWHCFGCGAGGNGKGRIDVLGAILGIVQTQKAQDNGVKPMYEIKNSSVLWNKPTKDGHIPIQLANFRAKVEKEIIRDDGVEQMLTFAISGNHASGRKLPVLTVPSDKFGSMLWVTAGWGVQANISAGYGAKDRLREAIQLMSSDVSREHVFTHIGWRKVNGKWVYLHAGGSIGAKELTVEPDLEVIRRYMMPEQAEDINTAVKASLDLLNIAPREMIIPLLAAAYRAPTCTFFYPPLTLWLYGETGSLKSTLAALVLSHFGGPFRNDSLPGSWLSTDNSLERLIFLARDTLLVIDDYAPEQHQRMAADLDRRVNRIVRSVGNRTNRSRLRADLKGRPDFLPNAFVVSTGEQLPLAVGSVAARIFPVRFEREQINMEKLTIAQQQPQLLTQAMRGFIEWLQPQIDDLIIYLPKHFEELRAQAATDGHARIPENIAHLFIGWEMFLAYALDIDAITNEESTRLKTEGWETLLKLAAVHAQIITEERPTVRYISALSTLLSQGVIYIADRQTGKPVSEAAYSTNNNKLIGWVDDDGVYLLPEAAWDAVAKFLETEGGVGLRRRAMEEMLIKEGVIFPGKGRATVTIRVPDGVKRVLHLNPNAVQRLLGYDEL